MMKRLLLAGAAAVALGACATVQHGPVQRINVDSNPSNAVVRTERCGPGSTKQTETPGVVWVSRRAARCTLVFSAPGYDTAAVVLRRAIAEEFLQNADMLDGWCNGLDCADFEVFLVGGIIAGTGFGVDAVTGALFEQQPKEVYVELAAVDTR